MNAPLDALNLSTLLTVCTSNGVVDEALLLELLGMFLSDNRNRIQELNAETGAGNTEGVRRLAHTISGSASTAGAVRLAAQIRRLEEDAREGRLPSADDLAAAQREFAGVESALLARYPSLQSRA